MQKQNRPRANLWRNLAFGYIVLLVIIIDQLAKFWITENLQLGQVSLDNRLFRIIHIQNTGAAFGIFKGHVPLFIIIDFIGIIVILYLVFFMRQRWPLLGNLAVLSGIALILGGTIGNLIDRLRLGYVTDFIDFKVWPVFNAADASVTVGAIILVYCLLFMAGRETKRE